MKKGKGEYFELDRKRRGGMHEQNFLRNLHKKFQFHFSRVSAEILVIAITPYHCDGW